MVATRLLHLMETYHLDALQRNTDLNEKRFMYEESPHYEEGYLMSEILDRYRKMVMHVKRPMLYESDTVFDTLHRVELIQKLYFEIYHLVNMAHEIRRKYRGYKEFANLDTPINQKTFFEELDRQKFEEKKAAEEKKKNERLQKQMDELIDKEKSKNKGKKEYNKWWPIDYGWEIDYYW